MNKGEPYLSNMAWKLLREAGRWMWGPHRMTMRCRSKAVLPSRRQLYWKSAKSPFRITFFQEEEDPALKGSNRNVLRLGVQVCKNQTITSWLPMPLKTPDEIAAKTWKLNQHKDFLAEVWKAVKETISEETLVSGSLVCCLPCNIPPSVPTQLSFLLQLRSWRRPCSQP